MWNNSSSPTIAILCDESLVKLAITLSRCIVCTLLLVPMCIFVFYFSYLQWKPHRSCRSISHSDAFILSFAAMEVVSGLGFILYFTATTPTVAEVGLFLYGLSYPGEVLIHPLISLDRYLAVVYPIIYLKQKQTVGIKMRNICIAIVWAYCLGYVVVLHQYYPKYAKEMFTSLVIIASVVISFCSGFILKVLIRPGPSDVEKVDKTKRKAFYTIIKSMVVVLTWFVGVILGLFVVNNLQLSPENMCIFYEVMLWFNIPSNIMTLVMYIQRNKKCTKKKSAECCPI